MGILQTHKIKPDFDFYKTDLNSICKSFGVRRLMSFGSVNTDRFGANSDIDLLVMFDKSDDHDLFSRYFGLKERLEELFQRPVELVFDRNFKNPYFRESVSRTKRMIYNVVHCFS